MAMRLRGSIRIENKHVNEHTVLFLYGSCGLWSIGAPNLYFSKSSVVNPLSECYFVFYEYTK